MARWREGGLRVRPASQDSHLHCYVSSDLGFVLNGIDSTSWTPGVWKGKPMKNTEHPAPLTLQQLSQG